MQLRNRRVDIARVSVGQGLVYKQDLFFAVFRDLSELLYRKCKCILNARNALKLIELLQSSALLEHWF